MGGGVRVPEDGGAAAGPGGRFRGGPPAREAFEALDRTGRHQLILPLLQALTPRARRARLARVPHTLTGGAQSP
ncbi:hypothetical protein NJL88_01995 [Streptomyces sp. DK15]|uniref:YdeI/OmpD-associated family protein n=1 Tax=Streptomyces sp. DK15 TaxID=2957499 RepID=UPI0029BBF338|nr:hypothetical protein [Streptomyces sp. DK15]MDX2388876.1 hypothetical protein [Streptomyces sp. DK15]